MQLDWQDIAGQARRIAGQVRHKVSDYRYSIAAGVGVVTVGGVVWAASAPDYSPTYYVVKWNSTGLCTVVDDRPDNRTYKTMWFTTLKSVATRKAKELHENGRCARLDEGRKVRPFG